MYILGISAMSHDSAAALLDDSGIVVAAIEEGKLARTRTIGGIPRAAIQFCLERAGITWNDVAHIAVARQQSGPFSQQTRQAPGRRGPESHDVAALRRLAGGKPDRIKTLDHHLCHAASAFYPSGFEHSLIVSLDRQGDGRTGLIALCHDAHIRELDSIPSPHSLAWIYSQFTQLLGFRPHGDEHKTQWLSLVGGPEFAGVLVEMLRQKPNGTPHLNPKYFRREVGGDLCFTKDFYRAIASPAPTKQKPSPVFADSKQANLAASLQQAVATVLC